MPRKQIRPDGQQQQRVERANRKIDESLTNDSPDLHTETGKASSDPIDPKITSTGEHTIVDIEIEGKPRRVSVSREWIEDRLGLSPQNAANFSTDQRTEFIRTHLDEIVAAARASRGTSTIADLIFVHTRDFD